MAVVFETDNRILAESVLELADRDISSLLPTVDTPRIYHFTTPYHLMPLDKMPRDFKEWVVQLEEAEVGSRNLLSALWYLMNAKALRCRSNPSDANGRVAILVSSAVHDEESPEEYQLIGQFYYKVFSKISEFDGVKIGTLPPRLVFNASSADLEEVIKDDKFSSIVTIGHGRYGVWSASDTVMDWVNVADVALTGVLKSGFWLHLACTPLDDEQIAGQVPFPYFAMMDHNNIFGIHSPSDRGYFTSPQLSGINKGTISPVSLERIANKGFIPLLEAWKRVCSYKAIMELDLANEFHKLENYYSARFSETQDPFYSSMRKYAIKRLVEIELGSQPDKQLKVS